ncbi:hypothetical protein C0995_001862, partial [Termitomyces sp. Mi166
MSSKELEDKKTGTEGHVADTEIQIDVSYSNEGYSRAYGLKCDLNIWLQGVAIVLGQVQQELHPSRVEFATLALYAGLIFGATVTLFLAGVFGIAAGGAPNFITFASLEACLGFGLGG